MRKSIYCIASLLILSVLSSQVLIARATTAITYQQPIAYIGWDNNIWITDLKSGAGTRITSDGSPNNSSEGVIDEDKAKPNFYTNIQWSPTDSAFKVVVSPWISVEDGAYIFRSGQEPLFIKGNGEAWGRGAIDRAVWSLDGKGIVYLTFQDDTSPPQRCGNEELCHAVLEEFVIKSGETITIGKSRTMMEFGFGVGDGPSFHAEHLLAREWNIEPYMFLLPRVSLLATESGYIYTVDYGNMSPPTALASNLIEEMFPNGTTIDLSHQPATKYPASVPQDARNITLIPNSQTLIYSTAPSVDLVESLTFDQWEAQSTHQPVSLWRMPLRTGKPIQLWVRTGYDIGRILPTADGKGVVVSFVTSRAITQAKGIPGINEGAAHVELLYVDLQSGATRLLAIGGQPVFGKQPFTAIPAQ